MTSATHSAALDDRPDPIGTVDVTARSTPGTGPARSDTTCVAAATNRPQPDPTAVDDGRAGRSARSSVSSDSARIRSARPGATPTMQSRSMAIGRQKPSL